MAKFKLEFDTDNDAFDSLNYEYEVNRILDNVKERVSEGDLSGKVKDSNGNTVGHFDTEAR